MQVASSDSSPDFLRAEPGDIVVVEEASVFHDKWKSGWWLAHVIHVIGGARDPSVNSLFQVVDVDTGIVKTINADLVKGILRPKKVDS